MKTRMKQKRILALLLSFCMVFASLPAAAFAETQTAENITGDSVQKDLQQEEEQSEEDGYIANEYIVLHEDFFEKTDNGGFSVLDNGESELTQDITAAAEEALDGETDIAAVEENAADGLALVRLEDKVSENDQQAFVEQLQNQDGVIAVEKNREVHACEVSAAALTADTYSDYQYALESVRAFEAWEMLDLNTTTPITVAVVDTGIDYTHPDLAGKVLEGKNFVDYNSNGQKYSSANYIDDNGHGSHVAGIIAATTGNNMGISGVTGNLDIQLLPAKVLDDDGNGTTYSVVNGIKYAVDNGADIINMSLGSQYASSLEEAAVTYAESNGVLCVAAAGNESTDVKYSYPANYDTVLSVASVDKNDERSYFSNFGSSLDVSAPGSAILSTIPESTAASFKAKGYTVYGNSSEGYYAVLSGTSMASPYAAGVAAIYLATNPMADCADVREHLKKTARDVADIGFDTDTGYGVVDAAAALGEPIRRMAVRFKSPSANSEIYQKTNIKLQVNTNMDIAQVRLYLNEVKDETMFASVSVKESAAVYEVEWDTTGFADGSYTLMAKAFDADGNPVGDVQTVNNVNIQNRITNGFVLEVKDPLDNNASGANVLLAGKKDDVWYIVYEGDTTDLGYGRIKLSQTDYDYYNLGVSGSYKNAAGVTSYYYYNISKPEMGQKIEVNKTTATAQKAAFSMKDKDGKAISETYAMLSPCMDQYIMQDLDIWSMTEKTDVYASPGVYQLCGIWTPGMMAEPDYSRPAYYLADGDVNITENSAVLALDCQNAGVLKGSFDEGYEGMLRVEGKNVDYRIPFFSGKVNGKEIYLAPGEYTVKGLVSKEVDCEIWSAVLQKADPVKVTEGSNETIHFSAELKITEFKPAANSLQTDEDGSLYMYRGDVLRTVNSMSISGDSVISGFSGSYPTFSVYKKNADGTETMIYKVSDTWQTKGSTWDSKKDYSGVQPEAGNYRAELTFDAGALGGKSQMEFDFALRNKSASDETDLTLRMGSSYTLPYAMMDLYYWNDDTQKWTAAGDSAVADSKGRITLVNDNYTTNADGINVAVVRYSARQKTGEAVPSSYNGYQLYYYKTLDDLKNISLSSSQSSVYFEVHDLNDKVINSGNTRININLSLQSTGGGKLASAEPLPDVVLPAGYIYLPEGRHSYIYANFTFNNEEYFICNQNEPINSSTTKVILNGSETEEFKVTLEDGLKGAKIQPFPEFMTSGGENCVFTLASNRTYHWSKGSYAPVATVRTSDAKSELKYQMSAFTLNSPQNFKINNNLKAAVTADRSTVNINQSLSCKLNITDEYGNRLIGSAVKKGAVYNAVNPTVYTGKTDGGEQQSFEIPSYTAFTVAPQYYQGAGEHMVYAVYSINGVSCKTTAAVYNVTDGSGAAVISVEDDPDFTVTYNQDGSAVIKIKDSFFGYKKINVKIPASDYTQRITFTQTGNGGQIAANGIEDVFNQAENKHQAAFSVKGGDVITVRAELLNN